MLVRELEHLHQLHSLLGVAAAIFKCLTIPLSLMIKVAQGNVLVAVCVLLNAAILKVEKRQCMQHEAREEPEGRDMIVCLTSASNGNLSWSMPPCLDGVLVHAKCTNSLSTLQPTRSQLLRQR
jgi:hypothetical protein